MSTRTVGARAVWSLGAWLAFASFASSAHAEATGYIYVKSEPRGAQVFLDDEAEPRAKTPCLLRDVPVGEHVLRCRLEGYVDVTGVVRVSARVTSRATLAFTAEAGPAADPDRSQEAAGTDAAGRAEPGDAASERDKADAKPPKYVETECTVCAGTGLLQEMGCPKCKAVGYMGIEGCTDCRGTGRAAHRCNVCKGEGEIARAGRKMTCPQCKGKGKFPCILCRGTGKLKRRNPDLVGRPTEPCTSCEGTGFERQVKCLRCSGNGTLTMSSGGGGGGLLGGNLALAVRKLDINCPFCGGDGLGPPLCRKCRGAGVRDPNRSPVPCLACAGTGHEFHPCRACARRGWVLSAPRPE